LIATIAWLLDPVEGDQRCTLHPTVEVGMLGLDILLGNETHGVYVAPDITAKCGADTLA